MSAAAKIWIINSKYAYEINATSYKENPISARKILKLQHIYEFHVTSIINTFHRDLHHPCVPLIGSCTLHYSYGYCACTLNKLTSIRMQWHIHSTILTNYASKINPVRVIRSYLWIHNIESARIRNTFLRACVHTALLICTACTPFIKSVTWFIIWKLFSANELSHIGKHIV